MRGKRLERFLDVVLFFALLPGMVMAQKPDGDPQSSISGSGITLKLELPSYEIMQDEEGFHVIQVEGFSPFGLPGDPWLPRKVYNVAVPPDAVLGSLTLEVVDVQVVKLPGPYRLKPASPDIISEDSEGDVGAHQSSDAPASDTAPANFVRLLSPGQMRKWRFARLEFTPFQVDAATGELSVASELTVRINHDVSPAAKDEALLKDRVMDGVAQQLLINYGAARAWYQVTSGGENLTPDILRDQRDRSSKDWQQQADQSITHKQGGDEPGVVYDYVIITTNAIEAGSSKLANFIAHKQGQGYSVLTITEDEYGGLVGQSPNGTAEKVRKWLQDNYIAYSIEYVLLIGDPDPDDPSDGGDSVGDVPMKMCWPRRGEVSDEEAPTDYFFADLTGNWDLDGDQYYGEWSDDIGTGGVDFANELYVGRIPVYAADYTTLDNILQKIMDYENEANPESWRESTLLPMSFSNATYDGAPLAEQMMDDYVTAAGFSSWTQYQQGNGACGLDSIYPSDEELRGGTVVRDRWAANDYGLVLWWAHGSATSAAVGYGPSCWDGNLFSSGDASSLDDDHPSFTYQCSCLNGYPENTNNLQYAILKQGGIGTVSATRVSWFNTGVGYGDFDGSTTNSGIGYEYASRLVGGQPASNALYNAKASMTPEFATRLMNFYDFNLYGDPSTGLYTASAGGIKVAIYDHATTSDISYWTGGNWNSWSQYRTVLQNDPGGRFDVSIVTDLSAATLADFSRLILPDNAVPDAYLSDVAAWFTPGRRIIAADSATCYAAYSGFMWPASAGSNGYGTYWDYGSSTDDQEVLLAHKITEDYSVGDILSSIPGDAQMFSGVLPTDAEQITAKATDHTKVYVASRDAPGYGTIVVLGPYDTPPGTDVDELIRDAVEGPGIKVAIYDHATTSDISYWTGANSNSWSQYQTVLQNDPEGRFDVSIVTDLSAATLADFSRLILPDNAVPDAYLSDVAAWFTPGRRIISADSATCYAAYSGFMWPASAGSNGYGTYWDYWSSTDDQEVLLAHKITEDYSVGDILSSISGDAQMFSGMLPTDAEQITAKALGVAASGNRSQTNPQVNLSPSEDGGKVAPPGPAAGTVLPIGPELSLSTSEDGGQVIPPGPAAGTVLPVGPEVSLSTSEDGGQVTLSGPAVGTVGPADSAGSTWVVVSPNLLAVSRPAGAIPDNGYFYLIGGESSGGYLGKVQRYDPGSDTWDDTLATMPTPGSNLCAAAIGDDIYVPGGYNGLSIVDLQVYHTNSDTWATITTDPLPSARTAPACAAYNGKLYVVGGNDGSTYYNNAWVYDPASPAGSRWTGLANAPANGGYGGALAVGNQIFWAGMRNTTSDLASVYAYNPAGNVWTTYPSLQTARGGAGLWAIGDLLLVGGGGWDSFMASVEQYDTSLGTGGTWSSFGADLAQGRRTFGWATSASGDRLFAVAGWAGAYLAEAETLDTARMIYVASRDVPGHGTIIVLGPYQTSPGTDVEELIRDAVEGPGVSNTPPTISGLPNALVDHSTSLPVVIDLWAYASDAETPDSGLTYTIEGSPPPGAGVTIAGNRWLTVNPSPTWCGGTDVTVRVTDPGGLWDEDTFRVAVSWSCQG